MTIEWIALTEVCHRYSPRLIVRRFNVYIFALEVDLILRLLSQDGRLAARIVEGL